MTTDIYMSGTAPSLILSKIYILGNRVHGNSNDSDGGGINIPAGTATITNTVIAGNVADNAWQADGGGIFVKSGATLNLYFSTLADNFTEQYGSGLYPGGTGNIFNSIIYGNACDHPGLMT